jgi:hypothetical protein
LRAAGITALATEAQKRRELRVLKGDSGTALSAQAVVVVPPKRKELQFDAFDELKRSLCFCVSVAGFSVPQLL